MFLPRGHNISIIIDTGPGLKPLKVDASVLEFFHSSSYLKLKCNDWPGLQVFMTITDNDNLENNNIKMIVETPNCDIKFILLEWCHICFVLRCVSGSEMDMESEYYDGERIKSEATCITRGMSPSLERIAIGWTQELVIKQQAVDHIKTKLSSNWSV